RRGRTAPPPSPGRRYGRRRSARTASPLAPPPFSRTRRGASFVPDVSSAQRSLLTAGCLRASRGHSRSLAHVAVTSPGSGRSRRASASAAHGLASDPVQTCTNCRRESEGHFRFCPYCAAPLQSAVSPHEQRKTLTVLFCDVTGSTALGESTDPEALRALLARYFQRMKGIVEGHGGTVEKFIGDAVMAVFGVPVLHEDDALRACRAAVEMRNAFAD